LGCVLYLIFGKVESKIFNNFVLGRRVVAGDCGVVKAEAPVARRAADVMRVDRGAMVEL
jgi:hypothetical protein